MPIFLVSKNEHIIEFREMKIEKEKQKTTEAAIDKEAAFSTQQSTILNQDPIANAENEATDKEKLIEEPNDEEVLAKKVEDLEEQLATNEDKYLRLTAEFDNYRKRSIKEKANLILNGGEKSFTAVLPVLDDMERALDTLEKSDDIAAIKEGMQLIYKKFVSVLEQNGVKAIETDKLALDTDLHEAIAMVPTPDEELKGKIIDCVQRGYKLNDKVIRHAKVVVGQ